MINTPKAILCEYVSNCHCDKSLHNLKSNISHFQNVTYLIALLFVHFNTINGQSIVSTTITSSSTQASSNKSDDCALDNQFIFGLSLGYAGVSIITLIGVSLWYEFGGLTLFIIVVIEFLILFWVVYKSKEFSFFVYFVFSVFYCKWLFVCVLNFFLILSIVN